MEFSSKNRTLAPQQRLAAGAYGDGYVGKGEIAVRERVGKIGVFTFEIACGRCECGADRRALMINTVVPGLDACLKTKIAFGNVDHGQQIEPIGHQPLREIEIAGVAIRIGEQGLILALDAKSSRVSQRVVPADIDAVVVVEVGGAGCGHASAGPNRRRQHAEQLAKGRNSSICR